MHSSLSPSFSLCSQVSASFAQPAAPAKPKAHRSRRLRYVRQALRRLLPVRERRVARRALDPGRPQPLRQLRRALGPQPGHREEDPRGDVGEDRLAEGLPRAEGLRLLRDRHGRGGASRRPARSPSRRLRDDRRSSRRPATCRPSSPSCISRGPDAASTSASRRTPAIPRATSGSSTRAASACPTATTT